MTVLRHDWGSSVLARLRWLQLVELLGATHPAARAAQGRMIALSGKMLFDQVPIEVRIGFGRALERGFMNRHQRRYLLNRRHRGTS